MFIYNYLRPAPSIGVESKLLYISILHTGNDTTILRKVYNKFELFMQYINENIHEKKFM